jgi:hypothetical protein
MVTVAAKGEDLSAAVAKGAQRYGARITAQQGDAEFIGTNKQDGTDAEQRADANLAYEGIIASSGVPGAQAVWARVHDNYSGLQPFHPLTSGREPDIELEEGDDADLNEWWQPNAWKPSFGNTGVPGGVHGGVNDWSPDQPRDERGIGRH